MLASGGDMLQELPAVPVRAYLVVGWDHAGDVADGEGLAGLQAQGHRRAHAGVGAGEHHVLHTTMNGTEQSAAASRVTDPLTLTAIALSLSPAWLLPPKGSR